MSVLILISGSDVFALEHPNKASTSRIEWILDGLTTKELNTKDLMDFLSTEGYKKMKGNKIVIDTSAVIYTVEV